MKTLPALTASLCLRCFVPEDAGRLMALNAEPTTRRWLPSHVYADLDEARSTLAFPMRDEAMRFQGVGQTVSRYRRTAARP